jgi:hypothetical protein
MGDSRQSQVLPAAVPATLSRLLAPVSVPLYRLRSTHLHILKLQRATVGTAQIVTSDLALYQPSLNAYAHLMTALL